MRKYDNYWRKTQADYLVRNLTKVISNVKKMNIEYSNFDISDRLYNNSEREIVAKVGMFANALRDNNVSIAQYERFREEFRDVLRRPKTYLKRNLKVREDTFIQYMKSEVNEYEAKRAKELLNLLTPKDKEEFFFRSNKFLFKGFDYEPSLRYLEFQEEYGQSVTLMKLEDYLYSKGYDFRGQKKFERKFVKRENWRSQESIIHRRRIRRR